MTNYHDMHTLRHPLVQQMRDIAKRKGVKLEIVALESGVARSTIADWSCGQSVSPNIARFERVLRVLGCKLAIVDIEQEKRA